MSTVLIADNDSAVSSLLTEVLVRAGLSVRHAFDGESAREQASLPDVRVLVCDLDMPKASGLEVLESLAARPSQPAVVVISGYLDQVVVERLRRLAFVREVMRKPFDLLAFAQRVVELVRATGAPPVSAAAGP